MLDNIITFGLAAVYMLGVAVFAIACVLVGRWVATKLEDMLG